MTTTRMSEDNALQAAREIAGSGCSLAIHHGADRRIDRAIRITGCQRDDADSIGPRIAEAIGGDYRSAAGFCAVWF